MPTSTSATTSRPEFYTEARHTAHGRVTGDVPLYDTGSGLARAEWLTAKYACRTQRGETTWRADGLELGGLWVTQDNEPDPGKVLFPNTTVLLYAGIEPDWSSEYSRRWFPHHLRLKLPGRDAAPTTADIKLGAAATGESPVTEVRTYTELRHTVYAEVAGAGPLSVAAHEPGEPDRWMLPDRVSVTWLRRSQSHLTGWQIADLAVTGRWCNDLGEPLPDARGSVRWPGDGGRPQWLNEFLPAHAPADTDGITTDRAA